MLPFRARMGAMAMKGYSAFPRAPALLKAHYQTVQCHTEDTRLGSEEVRVFCSCAYLGQRKSDREREMGRLGDWKKTSNILEVTFQSAFILSMYTHMLKNVFKGWYTRVHTLYIYIYIYIYICTHKYITFFSSSLPLPEIIIWLYLRYPFP